MGGGGKIGDPKDMALGGVLQCLEAATLGMPFEVWKTRMGRFREEGNMQAIRNVYKENGIGGFWKGTSAKMVESALKGGILLYAKEAILMGCNSMNMSQGVSGLLAGAGGGVAQVSVMGPCTFMVTAVVTGGKGVSIPKLAAKTWSEKGIKGFYPGGVALTFRQSSNWASRQGITEFVREKVAIANHGHGKAKLTKSEEILCGTLGGGLSTWNQPFEVCRIQAQAAAAAGEPKVGMFTTMSQIVKANGPQGLFQGIVPRIGLGVWQTLFMVTGAKMVKDALM